MDACKTQDVKCALVSGGILHKPPRGTTAGGEVGWWDSNRRQVHNVSAVFRFFGPLFGPLMDSQNFKQEIDKERNVKGDQEKRRNAEFVSAAGENICGFPINIFGILNQKILGNHPVVSWCRNR